MNADCTCRCHFKFPSKADHQQLRNDGPRRFLPKLGVGNFSNLRAVDECLTADSRLLRRELKKFNWAYSQNRLEKLRGTKA